MAQSAESFRVVDVRSIDAHRLAALPNGSLELKLYAYSFSDSKWKADEILDGMVASARLLAQCGISVTTAELRVLDVPQAFKYYYTPTSRELLRHLDTPRP